MSRKKSALKSMVLLFIIIVMSFSWQAQAGDDYIPLFSPKGNFASFVALSTGQVATIKSDYDELGINWFIVPGAFLLWKQNLEKTYGNFAVDNRDNIFVTTRDGYFYRVDKNLFSANEIAHAGSSYYVKNNGNLVTIRNDGILVEYGREFDFVKDENLKKSKIFGGTFILTRSQKLLVIDPSGYVSDLSNSFNYTEKKILDYGHNWLVTKDGKLWTIGFSATDENGFYESDDVGNPLYRVTMKSYSWNKTVAKRGGNYFFDTSRNLHTISLDGGLNLGNPGREFKVSEIDAEELRGYPKFIGLNYFIYEDNQIYQVAESGMMMFLGTLPVVPAKDSL